MNYDKVLHAATGLSVEEKLALVDIITKQALLESQQSVVGEFRIGDTIQFTSKSGQHFTGRIVDRESKAAVVKLTTGSRCRVAYELLRT